MDAIIWLSIIAISIYLAFKVGSKLSSGSSIEKKKIAKRSGFAVAGFWLLWTFGFSTLFVGYALTGHKAQGGGWDYIFLDLENFWTENGHVSPKWVYTSAKRAKKKLYLVNYSK